MIKTCLINDVNIWTRLRLTDPLKTLFNHYDDAYKFWIQLKLYWNFNIDLFNVFYSVIFRSDPRTIVFFDDREFFFNVWIHRDNIIHSYPPSDLNLNSKQNIFPETYILSNLITFIIKENLLPHYCMPSSEISFCIFKSDVHHDLPLLLLC